MSTARLETISDGVSQRNPENALTWEDVRAFRLGRQYLDRRAPRRRMLEVVSGVCGLHAQVPSSAELQVWARVDGASPGDVRDALWKHRTLVRTWSMRGTLHLLTAEDLPLFVAALRTHDRWWKGAWLRMIGMKEEELRRTLEAIHDALGARPVTRERLAEQVGRLVGPGAGKRMLSGWGEMLKPAAFQGSLVSGPPSGQKVTFVRPDRWLRGWREPPPEEAWPQIVRRYLRTYGPATREDFARWWGMQPAAAGRILEASRGELGEVAVEGAKAWALAEDVGRIRKGTRRLPVRLLPAFDVYVAGTRPRASLMDVEHDHRVFRAAGWISPVVLVDAKVAAVWSLERSARRLLVTVEPFGKVSAPVRKAIQQEADRMGAFLGAPASVTFVAAR